MWAYKLQNQLSGKIVEHSFNEVDDDDEDSSFFCRIACFCSDDVVVVVRFISLKAKSKIVFKTQVAVDRKRPPARNSPTERQTDRHDRIQPLKQKMANIYHISMTPSSSPLLSTCLAYLYGKYHIYILCDILFLHTQKTSVLWRKDNLRVQVVGSNFCKQFLLKGFFVS